SSPLPILAQGTSVQPATEQAISGAVLQDARNAIKDRQYEHAIVLLQGVITRPQQGIETLREAYLLLIKAFVYQSNEVRDRDLGTAKLCYDQAKALIGRCLAVRELRHTRPEPESEYPREMVDAFRDVRGQIFGSFRVSELTPEGALVLFDADTL